MLAIVPSVTAAAATGFTTLRAPRFGMGADTIGPTPTERASDVVGWLRDPQCHRLRPFGPERLPQDVVAHPSRWMNRSSSRPPAGSVPARGRTPGRPPGSPSACRCRPVPARPRPRTGRGALSSSTTTRVSWYPPPPSRRNRPPIPSYAFVAAPEDTLTKTPRPGRSRTCAGRHRRPAADADDVDLDRLGHLRPVRQRQRRDGPEQTGVVHPQVDAPEPVDNGIRKTGQRRPVGDVDRRQQRRRRTRRCAPLAPWAWCGRRVAVGGVHTVRDACPTQQNAPPIPPPVPGSPRSRRQPAP